MPVPEDTPVTYLTSAEAAQVLQLSVEAVRELCRRGVLPGAHQRYTPNGPWLIPMTAINAWQSTRTISPEDGLAYEQATKQKGTIDHQSASPHIPRWAWWFLTIIGIVGSIGSSFPLFELYHWLTPYFNAAHKNETVIVIAEFVGNGGYDPTTRIFDSLANAVENAQLKDVRIERSDFLVDSSQAAVSLGRRYSATVVIWGLYDDAAIEPRFEVIKDYRLQPLLPELSQVVNTNTKSFHLYLAKELPSNYEHMTFVVMGIVYLLRDEPRLAIELYSRVIDTVGTTGQGIKTALDTVYSLRGFAYLSLGHYLEAQADLHESAAINPHKIDTLTNLAVAELQLGNSSEAIEAIDRAIALDPTSHHAHDTKGLIYYSLDDYEKAAAEFTLAQEVYPGQLVIPKEMDPSMRAGISDHRGLAYSALGKIDEARFYYRQAISIDPDFAIAYHNLGHLELESGLPQVALIYFNRALELDQSDPKTFQGRGVAYRDLGMYEYSMADFEHVIAMASDYGGGYYERGVLHMLLGNSELALQDLNKAIEIWPDNIRSYQKRSELLFELSRFNESLTDLTSLITLEPAEEMHYLKRGSLYISVVISPTAAHADFTKVIELNPNSAEGYSGLGWTYLLLGYPDVAMMHFEYALKLNARDFSGLFGKGIIQQGFGLYEESIDSFADALTVEPSNVVIYLLRVYSFTKLGKLEDAELECRQFLELAEPNLPFSSIEQCLKYSAGDIPIMFPPSHQ